MSKNTKARTTDPIQAARSLANCINDDGTVTLNLKVRLYPVELMLLARRSRYTGESVDEICQGILNGADEHNCGILHTLQEYENDLPKGVGHGKQAS